MACGRSSAASGAERRASGRAASPRPPRAAPRPQAMIDGDRDKLRPALSRLAPARGEHEQRGRIRPAGDGKDQERDGRRDRRTALGLQAAVSAAPPSAADTLLLALDALLHGGGRFADTCGPPRRAWRRTFPSASWRQAIARAAAAPPAPWRGCRAWWRDRGRPALRHRSAGAGTGSRRARIPPRRRGGRSDISSGTPGRCLPPARSPCAAHSRSRGRRCPSANRTVARPRPRLRWR